MVDVYRPSARSKMASQPGRNIRNYISKNRFSGFFDGLTAANKVQFFKKIDHYFRGLNVK